MLFEEFAVFFVECAVVFFFGFVFAHAECPQQKIMAAASMERSNTPPARLMRRAPARDPLDAILPLIFFKAGRVNQIFPGDNAKGHA